jgi:protein involved in polysaccharide export with SLBB domain
MKAVPETAAPGSEFQEFVSSSVGRKLPTYGYSLFDGVPTTFAPVDRVPVTADYVIGPGDELLIRAWGQIDLDARVVVDRSGDIYLPRVGSVSVSGLKYQQLPDALKSAVGKVFRNFDLTVNLGQLRSIQIFLVGQARRPGSYTVSSLSTLVNALFASGGPSISGSMRHIQLKRDNQVVAEFDLYDLLLAGDKSKDTRLLPGDVIYIPPVGPLIAIAGSVNVPAIYELREAATLGDAIGLAGGLTTTASGQKVMLERIEKRTTRKVEEFPLAEAALGRVLKDGDLIRVFSLSPRFENAVTLRGNVAVPGRYEWHRGMRIRDLIPTQDALVTRDYWQKNNVSAWAPPQIARSVPEVNWDYAVIQRLNPQDLTARLLPFNLGKAVLERDPENDVVLEPGDIVTIFSQADLAVPQERRTKFVRLEGEFRAAGVYRVQPGETLRQLVERAGGISSNAYLYGSEFTRESTRAEQQKGLDELLRNLDQEFARNALVPAGFTAEESKEQRAQLEAQRQLIDKLRQVKAVGRVVLELKAEAAGADALPNLALEDGDRLLIPHRPAAVNVLGAVYNKNSFLHRNNRRVSNYLKLAGGPTRDADTSRMFILRADGSVLSKQSLGGGWWSGSRFESLRLMPGDAVVVPDRLHRGTTLKSIRDWSQVFSQFALGAAAINVLK